MNSLETLAYQARVKADFSNASETYTEHAAVQHQNYKVLAEYAAPFLTIIPADSWAIDIGSGPGFGLGIFQHLCQHLQWLALDISEAMLSQHTYAKYKTLADMQQLPIASHSMALVLSNFALHWSTHIEQAFEEAWRVLCAKGIAVLSFPILGSLELLAQVWREHNLLSPLHPMPNEKALLYFLQQQGFHFSYQCRLLPLELCSAQACFQWLKQTGVRHKTQIKAQAEKKMTKEQYRGIVNSLTQHFNVGEFLEFKMMDVLLFKV